MIGYLKGIGSGSDCKGNSMWDTVKMYIIGMLDILRPVVVRMKKIVSDPKKR